MRHKKQFPRLSLSLHLTIRILLLGAALAEAGYGMLQLCGVFPSLHHLFPISGSFYNPGPYGCFLALSFPLALAETFKEKGFMTWLGSSVLLLDAVMLPLSMSRTAWTAAALGSVTVFLPELIRFFRRSRLMIPFSAIILIFLSISLFTMKEDSARGRLLIWKVALQAVNPSPFAGVGPENVAGAYGEAQEAYFAEAERPEMDKKVAGAPEFVFNEYLQTAIAYGWGAALLLLILFVSALAVALRNRCFPFAGCIVASMTVMAASYPFQFPLSAATIALILAGAFLSAASMRVVIPGLAAAMACAVLLCHPYDRKGIGAAFEIGRSLHRAGKWEQSNECLMKLLPLTSDPMPLNIIGKNWQNLGRTDSAEHYMLRASRRCPNRLYPHYLLMKLYADTTVFPPTRAASEAFILLHMNVKVKSPAVDDMHREARQILQRLRHETKPIAYY